MITVFIFITDILQCRYNATCKLTYHGFTDAGTMFRATYRRLAIRRAAGGADSP